MNIKDCLYLKETSSFIPSAKQHSMTLNVTVNHVSPKEFSGIDVEAHAEAQMLKYLSDIVYGDIKREVVYLNTLVDKLKRSGAYTYGLELEESLNSLIKLCDLSGGEL